MPQAQQKTEDLKQTIVENATLPELSGIPGAVQTQLRVCLETSQRLNLEAVCASLNMSKRTLQRRLSDCGLTFFEIRDKVRFHYAVKYLLEMDLSLSITDIATKLDYYDRTSFNNAHRRWTGISPQSLRKLE